jgi:hypothetical protein
MKIENIYKKGILVVITLLITTACGKDFLNVNVDPNNPSSASLELVLPGIQAAGAFWTSRTLQERASVYSRQYTNLTGSTYNVVGSDTGNDFAGLFSAVLKESDVLAVQATEEGRFGYLGIAKVMKAYFYSVAVDMFGDVPYTEALSGETIQSPKYDDGRSIYDELLTLLDDANIDLQTAIDNGESAIGTDLVYGNTSSASTQFTNWMRAANTLKLKLYINLRLVDAPIATSGINALIVDNLFIDANSNNFQFLYGTGVAAPENRHPIYQREYAGAASKNFYMDNYFMYKMHSKSDPRLAYYIFRQGRFADLDFDTTPCSSRTDCAYWDLLFADPSADGLIGRDHGDPSGIPGDGGLRATFGVYPIGGTFDNGSGGDQTQGAGAGGAGIIPWITSSMRAFMLAEAVLTLGVTGDAKALMSEGIAESMSAVSGFAGSPAISGASITVYTGNAETTYDAAIAISNESALDVVIQEKYFAEFGNGFEAYNDIRRTGYPSDLPFALAPTNPFPLRFQYPPTELTTNINAPNPAPLLSEAVFWDVN